MKEEQTNAILKQPLDIAKLWFEAFNAHDIEKLLALYDTNAVHYSPKLKIHHPESLGLIQGKAALRSWWTDAFSRLPNLSYEVINLIGNDHAVFMEYIRKTTGEDDLRVGETLEIRDGVIVASRVYHS
jgi:hypothetical protein